MNEYERRFLEELHGPWSLWDMYGKGFSEERFEQEMTALHARRDWVLQYAWAIPTDSALDAVASLAPLVEVGAGGGYWAMLLRERGVDVVAYDREPDKQPLPFAREVTERRLWSEVLVADAEVAASHPDRTLFLCWPPYDSPMAHDALAAYLRAGGTTLAYVGEDEGGCNGDDAFWRLLDERMSRVDEPSGLVLQWPGMHDYLSVYRAVQPAR